MKNFSVFPSFIEQIESRLITHNPWLWSTRIVRHLWLLLIFNVVLAVGAFLTPINLQSVADPEAWFLFLMIFLAVYGIYWIYQQVIHNIERDGGSKPLWLTIPDLIVKWFGFCLLLSIPFTPAYILSRKIDASISDEEFKAESHFIAASDALVGDRSDFQFYLSDSSFLNRYNANLRYNDSYDDYYDDDVYYSQQSYEQPVKPDPLNGKFRQAVGRILHFTGDIHNDMYTEDQKRDSIAYHTAVRDSIIKNYKTYFVGGTDHYVLEGSSHFLDRDSLFIACRDLTDNELKEMFLNRKSLHIKYGSDYSTNPEQTILRFRKLVEGRIQQGEVDEYLDLHNLIYDERSSSEMSYRNRRLVGKVKDGKLNLLSGEMYLFFSIFFFGLAILLWVFRSIHWKWFILAIVVGIGLMVLSGIIISWFDFRGDTSVFIALFLAYAVVSIIVILNLKRQRFSKLVTVCLALFISFSAYMPGIVAQYMDKELDYFDRQQFYDQLDVLDDKIRLGKIDRIEGENLRMEINLKRNERFEEIDSIVFSVFLLGLLLFLVASPAFQKVFNEQRSLPEPK
jgi:predicted membrane channel-forming protein YqfA (hemolysin III family)